MDIESFKSGFIKQVNKYRNNHGAGNLKSDSNIDEIAQQFAERLCKRDELFYSYNQYQGRDLGETVYSSELFIAPIKLAKIFYDECVNYDYEDDDPKPSNFTQLVWKNSEYIGFGMVKSSSGETFFVINYFPAGNVDGEFRRNVLPPGTPISHGSTKSNANKYDATPTKSKANNYDDNRYKKNEKKESYTKKEYNNLKEEFVDKVKDLKKKHEKKESYVPKEYSNLKEEFVDKMNDFNKKKRGKDFLKEIEDYDENKFTHEIKKHRHKDSKLDILNKLITNKKKEYSQFEVQSTADFSDFCLEALDSHNHFRRIHHVEPVRLSKELCTIAQNWSYKLANEIGHLEHSDNAINGETLGENLFFCYGCEPSGTMVCKNWYEENKKYDYSGDWKSGTGHFTQMIWKGTKEVGFGRSKNSKGQYYIVGNYYPAGNLIGLFKRNVLRP